MPGVRNIQMEGTAKTIEDLEHRIYMIRSQEKKAPNQALRDYRKASRRRLEASSVLGHEDEQEFSGH